MSIKSSIITTSIVFVMLRYDTAGQDCKSGHDDQEIADDICCIRRWLVIVHWKKVGLKVDFFALAQAFHFPANFRWWSPRRRKN